MWDMLKEAWQAWSKDKATRLGAALAYYTIFSLAPLLVIVIAIVGLVFGREAAQGSIAASQGHLGRNFERNGPSQPPIPARALRGLSPAALSHRHL